MTGAAYLITVWDSMASNWGDWDEKYICLSKEDAEAAKAELETKGHKVGVVPLPIYEKETR